MCLPEFGFPFLVWFVLVCNGLLICTVLSSKFKSKRNREADEGKLTSETGHSDSESVQKQIFNTVINSTHRKLW